MSSLNDSVLDVRHLKLVQAIAIEANVTRAAKHLFVSQSAVSHQLIELERILDVKLFHRVGKRMVPSSAGEAILKRAERMLGEFSDLEREVRSNLKAHPKTLRVTTACYTSYQWLPSAMASFATSHPKLRLRIVAEATRRAMDALIADEVDVAIVSDPPSQDMWECMALAESELVVLAHAHHSWPSRRKSSLAAGDLAGEVLFVHDLEQADMAALESALHRTLQTNQPMPHITIVPLTGALVELVRADQGIALVDRWMIEKSLGTELVAFPLRPKMRRSFYAVWRRANPRDLPLKELAEVIHQRL